MTTLTINELLTHGSPVPSAAGRPAERAQADEFQGVYQAADNWCWAAAAASVKSYYDRQANQHLSVLRQCEIVSNLGIFGPQACKNASNGEKRYCDDNEQPDRQSSSSYACFDPAYDRQYFLNRTLRNFEMLERSIPINSARSHDVMLELPDGNGTQLKQEALGASLDYEEIKNLLDANRLVCLRTVKNGSRHFIIIYGCEVYPDTDFLIWDPDSGPEVIEADRLEHEYGPITHKIVTRRPGAPK